MNHFLKRAMQESGVTGESLARTIGVDPRTVARWVSGERVPHPRHRAAVADVLGCDIFDLWPDQRQTPAWLRPWLEVEREATTLRAFELALVPGLLQTEAYARAVLSTWGHDPEEKEELVAGRMHRQKVLSGDKPPHCTFVLDETALRRGTPEIMRDQLRRLLDLGERSTIHVVPLGAEFYAGQAGPFTLATVDGRTLGVLEDPLTGRVTDDTEALLRGWEAVRSVALPARSSRAMIEKMVSEL